MSIKPWPVFGKNDSFLPARFLVDTGQGGRRRRRMKRRESWQRRESSYRSSCRFWRGRRPGRRRRGVVVLRGVHRGELLVVRREEVRERARNHLAFNRLDGDVGLTFFLLRSRAARDLLVLTLYV